MLDPTVETLQQEIDTLRLQLPGGTIVSYHVMPFVADVVDMMRDSRCFVDDF